MEEIILNYLKKEGLENIPDQDLLHKFKNFIQKEKDSLKHYNYKDFAMVSPYKRKRPVNKDSLAYYNMYAEYPEYAAITEKEGFKEGHKLKGASDDYPYNTRLGLKAQKEKHFSVLDAEYVVSNMCHTEYNKKYIGENYTLEDAKIIYKQYENELSPHTNIYDVYVAINAQYHDYCTLFKEWFGHNIDEQIIESAILFWFKDEDYEGFKLTKYFE